ncbi:MAG: hypothetical protein EOP22_10505 [Hyphomicrobiales bacterium]|nr:MAG: hypothetical protein EOP22_10505 [Hyphomicrobiales bacterium]
MSALEHLPNIGKVLAGRLREAGVETAEQLTEIGDAEAFRRIRHVLPDDACVSTRYALAGAVRGVRWHRLTVTQREKLAREAK